MADGQFAEWILLTAWHEQPDCPMGETRSPRLRTLIRAADIQARVSELGKQITKACFPRPDRSPLHLIGVLKGAFVFLSDLARSIEGPVTLDFLGVKSYGHAAASSGVVEITKDLEHDIRNLDVLLVEDIVDSGRTTAHLHRVLSERQPQSLRVAALLDKPERRIQEVELDYVGFQIPDKFVVGYGLDYAERYRHLPDICTLEGYEEETQQNAD